MATPTICSFGVRILLASCQRGIEPFKQGGTMGFERRIVKSRQQPALQDGIDPRGLGAAIAAIEEM